MQLDSNSAEARTSLATFNLFYEYDWSGGEREFRRAIALNPNYGFAHDQFGMLLSFIGQYDEAIAEGKRAIALDPLSPQVLIDASMAFMFKRDFVAARGMARRAGELDPTFFFPVMLGGWIDLEAGQYPAAIAAITKAQGMDAPPFVTAYLAYARGASGDKAGALAELDSLKKWLVRRRCSHSISPSSIWGSATKRAPSPISSRRSQRIRRCSPGSAMTRSSTHCGASHVSWRCSRGMRFPG